MSRTNDQEFVDLYDRTIMANSLEATWFHSIHSDAGAPDYNSTLLLWGQYYNGNEKVPNGGNAMSDIMVDILTRGMRTNTRGSIGDCSFYTWSDWCQRSGGPYLYVNRTSNMPSELSEAGFHTNPRQNQLNMNSEWKKLEAYTFYWSILKFHGIARPPVGIVAGIISDLESRVPINGANVTIGGQTYQTDTYESLFYKYTNDPELLHNGFYFIENLPNTELDLIVNAPGYYPDVLEVNVIDTFFTFQDVKLISSVPPYVRNTTPSFGDTNFTAYNNIEIEFSRPMNIASVQKAFRLKPSTPGEFSWSDNDRHLTYITDSLAFLTDYTLTVDANAKDKYNHIIDDDGDGISGDKFILKFRTGSSDLFPPEIVDVYPAANDTGIYLQPIISIAYDEQLKDESINDNLFDVAPIYNTSASVVGDLKHYIVGERSVLNFFPNTLLGPEVRYRTKIDPGFEDILGNTIKSTEIFVFTTAGYEYQTTNIDNFENTNVNNNWWQPQQSGTTTGIITELTSRSENNEYVNLISQSSSSMAVNYGWDVSAQSWIIRVYMGGPTPRGVHFDKSYLLQAYVFGDGSGNKLRFAVDDNLPSEDAPYHEVSPWYTLDWIGWKLLTWDMEHDGTGTWIGDGNLDGTLRFDSFQLSYQPGSNSSGVFYLDDLHIAKKVPSSLQEMNPTAPNAYVLQQNYPNPFNPETTIHFGVPQGGEVNIEIFDITGKLIKTIISEYKGAGYHKVHFDGSELASGIYIYTLQSGDVKLSRKMMLIK